MGTDTYRITLEKLIEEQIARSKWNRERERIDTICIAHHMHGGPQGGILWTAHHRDYFDSETGERTRPSIRFIGCAIIEVHGDHCSVKEMCESMGPYYYSCPLVLLEIVTEAEPGTRPEWREKVREYHRQNTPKQLTA